MERSGTRAVCTSNGAGPQVLVIGGGAAGMLAALFAAREGAAVTLLEKNEKLGKKVYITGKGRCNCTNLCDTEDFLREVPRNPRFLYSALKTLDPEGFLALLNTLDCLTKIERGRRAFPLSDHASDVTKALEQGLRQAGARIRLHAEVRRLLTEGGRVTGVMLSSGETLPAGAVIVCTGGLSYPSTGSTGDGYRWAAESGHGVTACRPSLTGLETKEEWPRRLQGLTLKNICLTAQSCGKIIYSEQGEMLFTHYGVSGPLALECSAHLPAEAKADLALDLKPALTEEQLTHRLIRELAAGGKKQLSTVLQALLPLRFAALFPEILRIDGKTPCSQVHGKMRGQIVQALKALPLTAEGLRGYNEAIVTRGGVDVKDLNAASMASRKAAGLYFAGEVIDVDAHTGGYNLQIAWSTGALAGRSAARYALGL
ncbi:MAG: NAD(P)/FAD-dependent oxidoreductase [Clostridiales bacterium]|nr:NAD(P)/FAD-dependent oxidoreductase [Clostridiales bacterium]